MMDNDESSFSNDFEVISLPEETEDGVNDSNRQLSTTEKRLSPVSSPPGCYQSAEVQVLQRQKEQNLGESRPRAMEDGHFPEKGNFESNEKLAKFESGAQKMQQGLGEGDMDTFDKNASYHLWETSQENARKGGSQYEHEETSPKSYTSESPGAVDPKIQQWGGLKLEQGGHSQPPLKTVQNDPMDEASVQAARTPEEHEVRSRTVVVEGITEKLDQEYLELFFENSKKSGGGPLEKVDLQKKSGRAVLVFEKRECAKNVLSKKKFNINGIEVIVHGSDHISDETVIKVSGIQPDMSKEKLGLFLESERRSGGGEYKEFEVDYKKGEALLTYKDRTVAKRVLSKKTLEFQKVQIAVSRYERLKWDRKTVLVTGIGAMDEEALEFLYENRKKSGGGPVESIKKTAGNSALVTFVNEADAARVLHQACVKRRDGSVIRASKPSEIPMETVTLASRPEAAPVTTTKSIMVLGVDENVTADVLEKLFENEGPVEKISIDPEFQMAIVEFEKIKVAQRVLHKGTIQLDKLNLILQPHVPENEPTSRGAEGGTETPEHKEKPSRTSNKGKFNCIEVSGLPATANEELVRLFFESTRHGGVIDKLTMNEKDGTAVIIFKEESTTKKVLQRHNESPLVVGGSKVDIKAIDTSLYHGLDNTSCAIQITGLPVSLSKDLVRWFFENKKYTGGGLLKDIHHYPEEGRAVVTYGSVEVAQRVIAKHQAQPIQYDDHLLQIEMLHSNSRPTVLIGPKQSNVLFLKNLNEEASADDIRYFLECLPRCKVEKSVFGIEPGTVLVYFVSMPGFEKFYELACQKPLKGSMIDIECVARSKSIEVYGLDEPREQTLQVYFENQTSNGGPVEHVEILTDDKASIVTFEKYGVAENVLSKTSHRLAGRQLHLQLHHKCIGILPPHHDPDSPSARIPSYCTVDMNDPRILAFILSTPPNVKVIEERIAAMHGKILWPDHMTRNVKVQIQCTLQRSMPNLAAKVKTWSVDVTGVFNEMLGDFVKDEINVLQKAWSDFLQKTTDLIPQKSNEVEVVVVQDNCTVTAVGKRNIVEKLMDKFRKISAKEVDKHQRLSEIIQDTINLKPHEIELLLAHKFPQNTEQSFQDMKIGADPKQKKVVFDGVPSEIKKAKVQMYDLIHLMKDERLKVTRPVCEILKEEKTREYLMNQFHSRNAVIVFDVSDKLDGEVMVYAKTPEELTSGVAIIRSSIEEIKVNVHEENRPCLKQPDWSQMMDTMMRRYEGQVRINVAHDTSSICVTANCRIIEEIVQQIKGYMMNNTVLEDFVNMEAGKANLLWREKNQELRQMENIFTEASVVISKSNRAPGFVIQGTAVGLSKAKTMVISFRDSIEFCEHTINKPGMPQYFLGKSGQNVLDSLENINKVVITVCGNQIDADESDSKAQSRGSVKPDKKHLVKATLDIGIKVKIVEGDITTYCVDAIVNAANKDMKHGAGVAKAIVDRGGVEIQQECSNVWGDLLPGNVYTSQAGRLPCQKIIHTVGPVWKGGHNNEKDELYESVYACLKEASDNLRFKTIAIPAISSGVFGYPKDKCCNVILTAVKDFCQRKALSCSLQEIHLIDNNPALIDLFLKEAKSVLGEGKVLFTDEENLALSRGHYQAVYEATGQRTAGQPSGGNAYWTKGKHGAIQTQQGIQVTIIQGSIISQQVDVIVNTTNKELNLGSGGVSKQIFDAAGPSIQTECKQKAPRGLKRNEVVETSGGDLRCHKIYHGACSPYKDQNSLKDLREFLTNCLTKAHSSALRSIAIPAIGTGNLKFPRPEVARAMFEETKAFSEKHVGTSLQHIHFVLYNLDIPTVQAFDAEVERLLEAKSSTPHPSHTHIIGEQQWAPEKEYSFSHQGARPKLSSQRVPSGEHSRDFPRIESTEICQLHLQHLKIILVKGDITKETTDAIVNSTGKDLKFESQVSKAILVAAGPAVEQECADKCKVNKHHIAVTRPGHLKCKHIIHVGAPTKTDSSKYQKKWKTRIEEILKEAVGLRCKSLSFPALGTGALGVEAFKMASTIFEAFIDFESKQYTCLESVRVVVFKDDNKLQSFQSKLQKMPKGVFELLSEVQIVGRERDSRTPPDEPILSFHIYGFDRVSLDQVKKEIDNVCDKETQVKVLETKEDQEVIRKLSDDQKKEILDYERSHHVQIQIEQMEKISRLRIKGRNADVFRVFELISLLFRKIEQRDHRRKEAEAIGNHVKWQYFEQGKFQLYPLDLNAEIEKGYRDKLPYVEFTKKDQRGREHLTRVTFKTMKETKSEAWGQHSEVDVRRYTGDIPPFWSPMKSDVKFVLVKIDVGSTEYNQVEQSFRDGYTHSGAPYSKTIIKIERLQNRSMYKKYMDHRVHLDDVNPTHTINERNLWHGTTADCLSEIHTNGFNRSFCGKNGTVYGKGVYFAIYPTLSDRYTRPNAAGHRSMYYCKVLTGEFTKGNETLLIPPPKNPNQPHIKFDSVVDDTTNPKMYVVFQDNLSYPEYLITYQ